MLSLGFGRPISLFHECSTLELQPPSVCIYLKSCHRCHKRISVIAIATATIVNLVAAVSSNGYIGVLPIWRGVAIWSSRCTQSLPTYEHDFGLDENHHEARWDPRNATNRSELKSDTNHYIILLQHCPLMLSKPAHNHSPPRSSRFLITLRHHNLQLHTRRITRVAQDNSQPLLNQDRQGQAHQVFVSTQ